MSALDSPRQRVAWPLPHDELMVNPKISSFIPAPQPNPSKECQIPAQSNIGPRRALVKKRTARASFPAKESTCSRSSFVRMEGVHVSADSARASRLDRTRTGGA